jgi:hypothetical protein
MSNESKKRILAIGGHVIKTAKTELYRVVEDGKVEMLIHNGGSIFHDFQIASTADVKIWTSESHSYPLSDLIEKPEMNTPASLKVWNWIEGSAPAPEGSVTRRCEDLAIPVYIFTGPGCDFWHLFRGGKYWGMLGEKMHSYFSEIRERFKHPFHYVCMGSAVIHPEVFTKAIAGIKKPEFTADVVDFLDMYRPRTRVSQYGTYYKMTHKEYLAKWITGEL